MMGLTQRQRECLDFIRTHVKEQGRAPSFEEISVALDFSGKGDAYRLVHALVLRGWITLKTRTDIRTGAKAMVNRGIQLVPPKYDHGAECLCEGCPRGYAQYQQIVQALKVEPPVAVRQVFASNFRPLSNSTRDAFLGIDSRGTAPRTRKADVPRSAS